MAKTKAPKAQKPKVQKATKSNASGPTAKTFDTTGKSLGTTILPKEIFGQKPSEKLLAQAFRVYRYNVATNTASTKTRGEVRGGGAKPWRQKGTGRARAGSRRSPIWVGGGITFGPRPKNVKLNLPKKMKQKALTHALSGKTESGEIKIISNLEKVEPKTKIISNLLKKLETKGSTLFVVSKDPQSKETNVKMALRNIPNVFIDSPQNLNAYKVLKITNILISKQSLGNFK